MKLYEKSIKALEMIGNCYYHILEETTRYPRIGLARLEYPTTNDFLNYVGFSNMVNKTCAELQSMELWTQLQVYLMSEEGMQKQKEFILNMAKENVSMFDEITNPKSKLIFLVWSLYHPKRTKELLKEAKFRGIDINNEERVSKFLAAALKEVTDVHNSEAYEVAMINIYSYVVLLEDWSDLEDD